LSSQSLIGESNISSVVVYFTLPFICLRVPYSRLTIFDFRLAYAPFFCVRENVHANVLAIPVTRNNIIIFIYWHLITAAGIVLNSCQVFVGFLAVFLVIDMGYNIFKGFSFRLCEFSPQNSCLSSPGLNASYFTAVFSSFFQVFSLVLESFKFAGPEAFVSLHSSSWEANFSTINDAATNDFSNFIWML
jgi:hypothetical protein